MLADLERIGLDAAYYPKSVLFGRRAEARTIGLAVSEMDCLPREWRAVRRMIRAWTSSSRALSAASMKRGGAGGGRSSTSVGDAGTAVAAVSVSETQVAVHAGLMARRRSVNWMPRLAPHLRRSPQTASNCAWFTDVRMKPCWQLRRPRRCRGWVARKPRGREVLLEASPRDSCMMLRAQSSSPAPPPSLKHFHGRSRSASMAHRPPWRQLQQRKGSVCGLGRK